MQYWFVFSSSTLNAVFSMCHLHIHTYHSTIWIYYEDLLLSLLLFSESEHNACAAVWKRIFTNRRVNVVCFQSGLVSRYSAGFFFTLCFRLLKKRIAKSIIETYSMFDPKNSDTTPNRWQFGSLAQSTSLTEKHRTTLSLEAGKYFPPKYDQVVSKFTEGGAEGIFLYMNQ